MRITPRERNEPTTEELLELLDMLKEAVEAGQMKALSFMLHDGSNGQTIVDYRGNFEMAELTARTVSSRIADAIAETNPEIAAAIRRGLANRDLHLVKH